MEITIEIMKPLFGGMGLGYCNGKAIFVHNAFPQDLIKATIVKEKKDYSIAEISSIIHGSPQRINPECKNFGICGGCSYLSINYNFEFSLKKQILVDALVRIGSLSSDSIPDIQMICKNRFHYRSHGTIKQENGVSGLFKRETNILIPFPQHGCLLYQKNIMEKLKDYRTNKSEYKVAIDCNSDVYFDDDKSIIREKENGVIFDREIDLFFQGNRELRSSMQKIMVDYIEPGSDESFLDIGCGVGFFSLYLSNYTKFGIGYDNNRKSIQWAKKNAKTNETTNIKFEHKSVEEINPFQIEPDIIVIDPPRAGISKKGKKNNSGIKSSKDTLYFMQSFNLCKRY